MNIYQAIHGVMDEVGAIGKNRKNQQQGFMYRGVDEVMNALQPAFVKHNIFVVPEVLEQTREERTTKRRTATVQHTQSQIHFLCGRRFERVGNGCRRGNG